MDPRDFSKEKGGKRVLRRGPRLEYDRAPTGCQPPSGCFLRTAPNGTNTMRSIPYPSIAERFEAHAPAAALSAPSVHPAGAVPGSGSPGPPHGRRGPGEEEISIRIGDGRLSAPARR